MYREKTMNLLPHCAITFSLLALLNVPASAAPINAQYVDDPNHCDSHSATVSHELGPTPLFPADEAMSFGTVTGIATDPTCGQDLPYPDMVISITNDSSTYWTDLFFVGDDFLTFSNYDGHIEGGQAMLIDDVGINQPLISESMSADLVFEPDETWIFVVHDWGALLTSVDFHSIGVGSNSVDNPFSSASIVANRATIPAPSSPAIILSGLLIIGFLRQHRRKEVKEMT